MADLPVSVQYATVTGTLALAVGDGSDGSTLPDGVPAQGTIRFSPRVSRLNFPADLLVVFPRPITCLLDANGSILGPDGASGGVQLVASDMLDSPFTWEITVSIVGTRQYSFDAVLLGGQTYDMSEIMPVPPNPGADIPSWLAAVQAVEDAAETAIAQLELMGKTLVVIEHGSNASAARVNSDGNAFTGQAVWVGQAVPANRLAGDFWWEASVVTVPVQIWGETASVDGPLDVTEVGGLPWVVPGTYAMERDGGELVFTSATSGTGIVTVDDGQTDVTFRATISARGTQYAATVVPRYVDAANFISLHRTSTSNGTYVIASRVSGTTTVLATLTGFTMTDGDEVAITTRADGSLIIVINDVEAYNGTVASFATATARGVGVRTADNALTVAFDDLSAWTIGD